MRRLEHGRVLPFRIEVRGGGQSNGAYDGGAKIGQNVPERIRRNDHVKSVRMLHKVSAQDINVVLIGSTRTPRIASCGPRLPDSAWCFACGN
jgi:hypothetical protein